MRIVHFGANGTVGEPVATEFSKRHEVIRVNRTSGDHRADLTDPQSVDRLFEKIGKVDAIVCTAGHVHFGPLAAMTAELLMKGLKDKVMGQANAVLAGIKYLNDRGSITLTSGVLSEDFVAHGSAFAMANGALEAFVGAAAIELPRGLRINIVNPGLLEEDFEKFSAFFQGFQTVSGPRVALAYCKSVEGAQTGKVYRVR
jgi:NAD(P)-dependent dehydrogenase (short-subunit alcohol dehydrogenase family)